MEHLPKKSIRLWPGLFVVFEGIDGVGKTTQIQRLALQLKNAGYTPFLTAEPTNGPYGAKIRQKSHSQRYSPEEEFQLFLQDRLWHLEEEVRPALDRGEIVLQDRYYYSSIAYQGVLLKDPERIRQANEAFCLVPDLAFYLDLPVQEALKRIQQNRPALSSFEKQEYLEQVRAIFLQEKSLIFLDASVSLEELTSTLFAQILAKLA